MTDKTSSIRPATGPLVDSAPPGTVRFDHVTQSFHGASGEVRVIDDLSFEVSHQRFTSLVGPSGCGKTTLLSMAAGFLMPTSGRVVLGDRRITGPTKECGVVFQRDAVFPWLTVRDNISFGLRLKANRRPRAEVDETVANLINLMGLNGFEDAYPKTLSGGMSQRVAIARAYAVEPELLLMDEPFAALDTQTRQDMQELLHRSQVQKRRTVLFVTHSVEEAVYLSDRVIVLSSRPSRVRDVIDVPIPSPRTWDCRLSREFVDLRGHIEGLLKRPGTTASDVTQAN